MTNEAFGDISDGTTRRLDDPRIVGDVGRLGLSITLPLRRLFRGPLDDMVRFLVGIRNVGIEGARVIDRIANGNEGPAAPAIFVRHGIRRITGTWSIPIIVEIFASEDIDKSEVPLVARY